MFTEEDGTAINNEDRKEFQIRRNAKIYPIFYLQEKSAFLKVVAQAFET